MFSWFKKKPQEKPPKEVEEDIKDDSELEKNGIDPID